MNDIALKKTANSLAAINNPVGYTNHSAWLRNLNAVAFQEAGGVEEYVEWIKENRSDFYTKNLLKGMGPEAPAQNTGDGFSHINVIDMMDAEDAILAEDEDEPCMAQVAEVEPQSAMALKLAEESRKYAEYEPID